MCILTGSRIDIPKLIKDRMALFNSFDFVYLFGSSINPLVVPNDIDILLIYTEYSNEIKESLKPIYDELEKATGLSIDLTVLSIAEEKDTSFLNRIRPNYLRIK